MENAPENWHGFDFAVALRLWKFYQFIPQAMKQKRTQPAMVALDRIGQNISAWLMTIQTRFPDSFAKISESHVTYFLNYTSLTFPTSQGTVYLSSAERGLKQGIGVRHV